MNTQPCTACNGTGTVERETNRIVYRYGQEFEEDVVVIVDCDECDGEGTVEREPLSPDVQALFDLGVALLHWEMESWRPYPKLRENTPEHREDA